MAEIKTFDPMQAWRGLPPETQELIGALAIANEVAFLATDQAIDADAAYWLHERTHSAAGDALADLIADNLPDEIFAASSDYPLRPDLNTCGVRQCTGCGCTDNHACEGGCSWAGPTLCTTCVPQEANP